MSDRVKIFSFLAVGGIIGSIGASLVVSGIAFLRYATNQEEILRAEKMNLPASPLQRCKTQDVCFSYSVVIIDGAPYICVTDVRGEVLSLCPKTEP